LNVHWLLLEVLQIGFCVKYCEQHKSFHLNETNSYWKSSNDENLLIHCLSSLMSVSSLVWQYTSVGLYLHRISEEAIVAMRLAAYLVITMLLVLVVLSLNGMHKSTPQRH